MKTQINPMLVKFLEKSMGVTGKRLTRDATLEEFYGIAELDTIMFYDEFVTEFQISVPDSLDISNHVSPVGFPSLRHLLKRLFSKEYKRNTIYRDLSIGELEEMIRTKKWISEGDIYNKSR